VVGVGVFDDLAEQLFLAAEVAADHLPIPGTLRISRLEENSAAAALTLADDEIARLDKVTVSGDKEVALGHNWFDGVTPQPRSS
jgi:diketogulonate reductase-like aldo/keto reductase